MVALVIAATRLHYAPLLHSVKQHTVLKKPAYAGFFFAINIRRGARQIKAERCSGEEIKFSD